ncbi:MAG: hypothetical protein IKB24_04540 [Alistipes sp.]|nr:hypothetical protein [Alistipes sp.]
MALANYVGIILVTHTAKIVVKKSANYTRTGNYLDTRITREQSYKIKCLQTVRVSF